jgi:glycosyltransferase involved in cell wall biosynthesis
MLVTYDLIHYSLVPFSGISRMWMEIFKQLPDPEIDPSFLVGPADNIAQDDLENNNFRGGIVVREKASGFHQKLRRLGFYRNFHLMNQNLQRGDRIFHSTDYINPLLARKSLKLVTTICDMVFWDQKDRFVRNIWYYDKLWCTYHACRISDQVLTISEAARQRILHYFPWAEEKVSVVHLGLDESLFKTTLVPNKKKRFIFVGGRNGHKNFDQLARAFASFSLDYPDWELHLVGPNSHSLEREEKFYLELGISDKVFDHGLVDQADLVKLLLTAGALVIPSLNEGFNLPLLEGMAAGCPVLSSDLTVSKELGKNHAQYFSPHLDSELLALMRQLADTPPTLEELSESQKYARTYRWENSFETIKTAYRKCLS